MKQETLTFLLNGRAHARWDHYELDSDLFVPADAWSFSLAVPPEYLGGDRAGLPPILDPGSRIQVLLGDDVVLTGWLDEVQHSTGPGKHDLNLRGRDLAAILVDCSAPVFTLRQATLAEVVALLAKQFAIKKTRIDAVQSRTFDRINIEPGDTAWDALQHAAEAAGLWPWFDPDGTLVVGGPDYSAAPVGRVVLGDVLLRENDLPIAELLESTTLARRFSEVTVLGQSHGTDSQAGTHNITRTAKDPSVSIYRPKIVIDHEAQTPAIALTRARKLITDSHLDGYTVHVTVPGHRAPSGAPWQPGQRVDIYAPTHELDCTLFVAARKFVGGRKTATVTQLTLKKDKVWIPDAHPHQHTRRRTENSTDGTVLDLDKKP
jgi:prophage tail gpP-like protein